MIQYFQQLVNLLKERISQKEKNKVDDTPQDQYSAATQINVPSDNPVNAPSQHLNDDIALQTQEEDIDQIRAEALNTINQRLYHANMLGPTKQKPQSVSPKNTKPIVDIHIGSEFITIVKYETEQAENQRERSGEDHHGYPGGYGSYPGGYGSYPGGYGDYPGGYGSYPGGYGSYPGGYGNINEYDNNNPPKEIRNSDPTSIQINRKGEVLVKNGAQARKIAQRINRLFKKT